MEYGPTASRCGHSHCIPRRRSRYEPDATNAASELFPTNAHQTAQNQRTTHDPTTPSALPGNSQKGMTKLYLNGHCYIKKRTLKASRDWKCTNKQCRGTIKTALDSYVVLKSKSHNRRAVSVINDVGKQEMATYLAVSHGMQ